MNIAVIGTGYVGLVSGVCFADLGNNVVCVDVDAEKVRVLQSGQSPIFEPGLSEKMKKNIAKKRIRFTTDLADAVRASEVIFIAVGTPQDPKTGEANLKYVYAAADQLGKLIRSSRIIVMKSTVPVGTTEEIEARIAARLKRRGVRAKAPVASNPEFLREGSAVRDFMEPDRVVIGALRPDVLERLAELYRPLNAPIVQTRPRSSEMIKYCSNALLASRISFINEIANVCESTGADVRQVARGVGLDKRIGPHFLEAGIGYGGSCFPKDMEALVYIAGKHAIKSDILRAVTAVNRNQRKRFLQKIINFYRGNVKRRRFAVLGLAFKANTDDMREAPSVDIISGLVRRGAQVAAYDPEAMRTARELMPSSVTYASGPYACVEGADAMIVLTEWNEFKELDLKRLKRLMKAPVVFDGRNLFSTTVMERAGFDYISVGRRVIRRA